MLSVPVEEQSWPGGALQLPVLLPYCVYKSIESGNCT